MSLGNGNPKEGDKGSNFDFERSSLKLLQAIADATSGGSGTVTSVGLSMPTEFTVSGSPVTTSGSITVALASQIQDTFLAAPSGSNGVPSFRAIVDNDIPDTVKKSQLIWFGGGTSAGGIPTSSTRYIPISGSSNFFSSESDGNNVMSRDGVITDFYVRTTTTQAGGGNVQINVRVNGSNVGSTITIPPGGAASVYQATSQNITFSAGDVVNYMIVNNSSGGSSARFQSISANVYYTS